VLLQGQSEASDASQIVRIIFDRSDDDATYFTGLCQTDRGDYAAAAETFRKYLEYFARSRQQAELAIKQRATQQGLPEPPADVRQSLQQALAFRFFWINSVRYNLALNEVRLGHKSEAARILRAIPSTNPQYAGYLHSMQLWDPKIAAEARQEMQAKLDEVIKKVEDQQKPKENQKPAAATSGASAQPEKPTAAPDPKSPAVKEPTPKATPAAPAKSAAQPAVDSKSPAAATSKQGGTDPVVTPAPTKTVPPAKESSPPKK
jgi:tetratricopeptide (TPR) repeat protein